MERKEIGTTEYWEENARWYKLWLDHNRYHERIRAFLESLVGGGWRILDIGGGSGVLSLPLARRGNEVVVVEPSRAMRELLFREAASEGGAALTVDSRRWEEVPPREYRAYDLVVCSNSLHLMSFPVQAALGRVMTGRPRRVLVVAEYPLAESPPGYVLSHYESFRVESAWVYHTIDEALEHWAFRHGRKAEQGDEEDLRRRLDGRNGHFFLNGDATVHLYLWQKTDASMPIADRILLEDQA